MIRQTKNDASKKRKKRKSKFNAIHKIEIEESNQSISEENEQ
jgi:hypothetical protein